MKANNRFEEMKIKMVMKLRGLTREAAVRALHLDEPSGGKNAGDADRTTACKASLIARKTDCGFLDDGGLVFDEEFFQQDN